MIRTVRPRQWLSAKDFNRMRAALVIAVRALEQHRDEDALN